MLIRRASSIVLVSTGVLLSRGRGHHFFLVHLQHPKKRHRDMRRAAWRHVVVTSCPADRSEILCDVAFVVSTPSSIPPPRSFPPSGQ